LGPGMLAGRVMRLLSSVARAAPRPGRGSLGAPAVLALFSW
jgi:hypothetical protein